MARSLVNAKIESVNSQGIKQIRKLDCIKKLNYKAIVFTKICYGRNLSTLMSAEITSPTTPFVSTHEFELVNSFDKLVKKIDKLFKSFDKINQTRSMNLFLVFD